MTPGEMLDLIEGYNWRKEERIQKIIYQAWLTAAFSRAKKLPKLNNILNNTKRKSPKKDNIEQHKQDYYELKKFFEQQGVSK